MSEFKFIKTIVIIAVIAVCFVLYRRHMESKGYSEGFDKAVKSAELLSDSGGTYTIRFGSNSHIHDYEWSDGAYYDFFRTNSDQKERRCKSCPLKNKLSGCLSTLISPVIRYGVCLTG